MTANSKAPDPGEQITMAQAAQISGLAPSTIRNAAAGGHLRTERIGALVRVTTRRWLDDYLRARGTASRMGRPPKPLSPDYVPPPRRGRPPKPRAVAAADGAKPPRRDATAPADGQGFCLDADPANAARAMPDDVRAALEARRREAEAALSVSPLEAE